MGKGFAIDVGGRLLLENSVSESVVVAEHVDVRRVARLVRSCVFMRHSICMETTIQPANYFFVLLSAEKGYNIVTYNKGIHSSARLT